jgi:crossover junction endodeoxyribonuclease RuvC
MGIDPGLSETGWAVVESRPTEKLLASGVIRTAAGTPLPERLRSIHEELSGLIGTHRPASVAVEDMFFTGAAATIRGTLEARGVILLAASSAALPISEYHPRTVKLALTGSGGAAKLQVRRMVERLLRLDKPPKPNDLSDAIAIALCHLRFSRRKTREAGESPEQ